MNGHNDQVIELTLPAPLSKGLRMVPDSDKKCEGLFYRCCYSQYQTQRGDIGERIVMRLLKKKSCKGCEKGPCDRFLEEVITEDVANMEMPMPSNPEDGDIYNLHYPWSPGPYEYPDDGDYEFSWIKIEAIK